LLIYPSLAVQFERRRFKTDTDRRTLLVRTVFFAMLIENSHAPREIQHQAFSIQHPA
jgi:hypothetical protein